MLLLVVVVLLLVVVLLVVVLLVVVLIISSSISSIQGERGRGSRRTRRTSLRSMHRLLDSSTWAKKYRKYPESHPTSFDSSLTGTKAKIRRKGQTRCTPTLTKHDSCSDEDDSRETSNRDKRKPDHTTNAAAEHDTTNPGDYQTTETTKNDGILTL